MTARPELVFCKRTDPRYKAIRDRHYIPNKGAHAQQVHYLVIEDGEVIGIISGGSAVYGCAPRDQFFDLPKEKSIKEARLNQIIDNTVFRLERTRKNLATQVLALWRRRVAAHWEFLYGVKVMGFETFVIEEERDGVTDRRGTLYLADNWTRVGVTKGNTKVHETAQGSGGMNASHTRRAVVPKLIFCKRVPKVQPIDTYEASWRDKERSKAIARNRASLLKSPFLTP